MSNLLITGTLFLATHLGLASRPLRPALIRAFSERGYLALYSLVALATLVAFVIAYNDTPRMNYWWMLNPALYWTPKVLMLPACILLVGGLMGATATTKALSGCAGDAPRLTKLTAGINRVTRHPVQWAFVLWAASHLVANGDLASVMFFAAFPALSLVGSWLADKKKAATLGEDWRAFAAASSYLPFAAIAAGRNRLALRELGIPTAGGLALYLILFWGHEWLSGVEVYW